MDWALGTRSAMADAHPANRTVHRSTAPAAIGPRSLGGKYQSQLDPLAHADFIAPVNRRHS